MRQPPPPPPAPRDGPKRRPQGPQGRGVMRLHTPVQRVGPGAATPSPPEPCGGGGGGGALIARPLRDGSTEGQRGRPEGEPPPSPVRCARAAGLWVAPPPPLRGLHMVPGAVAA